LQIRDTCGNFSSLSPYHNTIYMTKTGGTFNWNQYQIESQASPLSQLSNYRLLRDDNSTGNWVVVGAVAGSQTSINDPNYTGYPNGSWRIETQWGISCTPTKSLNTTRSNTKSLLYSGVKESVKESSISVYPNPFNTQTTISFPKEVKNATIRIIDVLGKEVKSVNFTGKELILEKGMLNEGIYFLQLNSENKKIIIQ
jgi:hypothetical protein